MALRLRVSPFGIDVADPQLELAVRAGLDEVEAMLRARVHSDYPFVDETSRHLLVAGGKRHRPLVVLLAAHAAGDATAPGVVPAAVAIELTHLSTLYHDDVMDEATLRRGTESANARWTNAVAILTGDFLFARASEITADLGTEPTRILARTIAVLCEGQIRETVGPGPGEDPLEHYLGVLADKTGSLIATAGRLGAMLAGGGEELVDTLDRFGGLYGVAFQLSDDLLDVASTSAVSGKTPGTDLREGVPTLPVLVAASLDPELHAMLTGDLHDQGALDCALARLRGHPVMDAAREIVAAWAEDAREALAPLPASPARDALYGLCSHVVTRSS
jgi:heptaprenyl diphosphate synthase